MPVGCRKARVGRLINVAKCGERAAAAARLYTDARSWHLFVFLDVRERTWICFCLSSSVYTRLSRTWPTCVCGGSRNCLDSYARRLINRDVGFVDFFHPSCFVSYRDLCRRHFLGVSTLKASGRCLESLYVDIVGMICV